MPSMLEVIIGCESSCDDSGLAVIEKESKRVLWNWCSAQPLFQTAGGVIPELAAREHLLNFKHGVEQLLLFLTHHKVSTIAYTQGPGLIGSLWVGGLFASMLAWKFNAKLLAVDHLKAHIFSSFIGKEPAALPFPFIALLASGGHTQLWKVDDLAHLSILGTTLDDAAGEAFDKAAKMLGLAYPGGPEIAKAGSQSNHPNRFTFPRPCLHTHDLNFSFSGLKTALRVERAKYPLLDEATRNDLAAAFEAAVADTLVQKTLKAMKRHHLNRLVIGGGVSANQTLRSKLQSAPSLTQLYVPEADYTGDNAAMIAYLGALQETEARPLDKITTLGLYPS